MLPLHLDGIITLRLPLLVWLAVYIGLLLNLGHAGYLHALHCSAAWTRQEQGNRGAALTQPRGPDTD